MLDIVNPVVSDDWILFSVMFSIPEYRVEESFASVVFKFLKTILPIIIFWMGISSVVHCVVFPDFLLLNRMLPSAITTSFIFNFLFTRRSYRPMFLTEYFLTVP